MIEFTVQPDGGEKYEVTATSRDIVVWEKRTASGKGGPRSFAQLMSDLRMTDMYIIAHVASKRLGLFEGSQADFEQGVDLEFDIEEEPDPTPPEASTDE